MKELQPLGQNVLLDLSENLSPEKTAGGIIIPDSAKEKPKFARITAIGNIEDCEVTPGDLVFFKPYSGTEIEFEGRKYLSIPYSELLAKIVETESI